MKRRAQTWRLRSRQLILFSLFCERYDPDPAAKAAAATVLASKFGAESGLKMYLGEESTINAPAGKSDDDEVFQQFGGLRKRKQLQTSISAGNTPLITSGATTPRNDGTRTPESNQSVMDHHFPQGPSSHDVGWIARIAALLVGEGPTQSYALICGSCHMHNGLARNEDLPYITYYCPHCRELNRPKQSEETRTGCGTPNFGTLKTSVSGELMNNFSCSPSESLVTSSSTKVTGLVIEEKK